MDNRLEEIAENYDIMKIGLDDKFRFHCTMCGRCCRDRHDILLSPYDLFRIAVGLDMKPLEVCKRYCHVYVGEASRIPIVRLLPVGVDERCPFLRGNRCSVNSFKPNVCALFPLGRAICYSADSTEQNQCDYILQPVNCGDKRKTYTVREWLAGANIPVEDPIFLGWHRLIADLSSRMLALEKVSDLNFMAKVVEVVFNKLYLSYDLMKGFEGQFNKASKKISKKMDDFFAAAKKGLGGKSE